ncbi:MAG: hypothetical protein HYW47_04045 [Deltaproteobacteria bacterium]|nr:hypothetical protein [Deltaproteobacteria bacterium]
MIFINLKDEVMIKNNLGQALIESVLSLPILVVLIFFFLLWGLFVSEKFLLKNILYQECRKLLVQEENEVSKERLKTVILEKLSLLPLRKKMKFLFFENTDSFLKVEIQMNYFVPWGTFLSQSLSFKEKCYLEK